MEPPAAAPAEQAGLWKSLWAYMVGPKQLSEPTSPLSSSPPQYVDAPQAPSPRSSAPELSPPSPPTRQPPSLPRSTFYSSWVSSLQLSLWDNIFGPQVVKAWPGVEQLEPDIQMHLARQVLSGEIGRIDSKGERVECSLHVLPEVDFVVASALFSAVYKGHSNTKFALSLLMRRTKHLRLYLSLQAVIGDRMTHLVAKYCTALQRDPGNALTFLNEQAATLATNLEGLYSALLPRIAFSDTHLYHASHGLDFVARATTAMIQTGSAVVHGPREEDVNTFIATLALFLSPEQRRRSALAAEGREYVPDLVLQGLVTRKVPEEALLHSLLPTALVDLQTLQIKRMHPYNEYVVLRKEFRELELERLFKMNRQRTMPEFSQQSLFTPVKKAAPCIMTLLQEAMRLDRQLREQHVQHAVMCLNRKAAVLVEYVQAELSRTADGADNASMDSEAIERMRENLDLQVEEDYFVVLSIAERLSPGIYCKVERNPELLPELIQELFESF